MPIKYLILVAALGGIIGLFFSRSNFARIIIVLMLAAIGLAFMPKDYELVKSPFIVYVVAVSLAILYTFLEKSLSSRQRVLMLLIAIPIFIANIFALNHWPHMLEVKAATLISFIASIIIAFRVKNYRNEAGFLVIMAFDALIHVIIAAKAIIPLLK